MDSGHNTHSLITDVLLKASYETYTYVASFFSISGKNDFLRQDQLDLSFLASFLFFFH